MADHPDGTLRQWDEIEDLFEWDTLLLGNGLSQNVWEPFGYRNLYEQALSGELTEGDQALFQDTPNFERVLGDLLIGIRVCDATGTDTTELENRYASIQRALAQAVRSVHLNRDRVPIETRRTIRQTMERFEWVFTTSYDLLVYWAMGCDNRFAPFMDHFRYGGRLEFDPERSNDPGGTQKPVYFLHGALHLVTTGHGATFKLKQTLLEGLLSQFGQPIEGEPDARPLLVTEGSARDKLQAIEANPYLSHALDRLYERDLPVVVFGSGLSHHDSHLAEALSEHPGRAVAVSMLPGSRAELLPKQVDIYGRLDAAPLIFFDATSHPLGAESMRVPSGEDDEPF